MGSDTCGKIGYLGHPSRRLKWEENIDGIKRYKTLEKMFKDYSIPFINFKLGKVSSNNRNSITVSHWGINEGEYGVS